MLNNIIVYDNNKGKICFKVKVKKDNGHMCAKRAEHFRSRGGGPKSRWGWTQNFGDGGGTGLHGGDNPLMGVGPPIPPPILGNPGLLPIHPLKSTTALFKVLNGVVQRLDWGDQKF